MEKPKSVEVGQRWKEADEDCTPYTVTAVNRMGAQISFDDGAPTHGYVYDDVLCDTFLGWAPGYSPSKPLGAPSVQSGVTAWGVGQRRRGDISDIVEFGDAQGVEYTVLGPHTDSLEYQWRVKLLTGRKAGKEYGACESWPSELLSPLPVLSTAPTAHNQDECTYCTGGIACPEFAKTVKAAPLTEKPRKTAAQVADEIHAIWATMPARHIVTMPRPEYAYGRTAAMELSDINGRPRTALEHIQARKPPEPYICPVDDWDLLADAGK